jgi:glycosyltransferase involved in cell wall biosynthesis
MRILLPVHVFFPTHFYGTETYTLELAKQLRQWGHEPVILTATPYGEAGTGHLHDRYEYEGLPVHCIDLNLKPHDRFRQTYYRPELQGLLRDIVSEIQPDVAHVTHLINHTATLLEVLQAAQVPTLATLTDFFGICFNNKLENYAGSLCLGPNRRATNCLRCYLNKVEALSSRRWLGPLIQNDLSCRLLVNILPWASRWPGLRGSVLSQHVPDVTQRMTLLKQLYGTYRYLIAPTDFLYEAYALNGFYPDRLRKINFGINMALLKGYQRPRKRSKEDRIRFGYIGQITSHKGVDLLIQAYQTLHGDNRSLFLYGPADQDPAYMKELLRLAAGALHLEFRGTFPRESLPGRLSELDVLVIPSRWYENSPLVLLYALATHTPVIVTDVKGMSEFVQDGFNGYTFEKNSVEHLSAAMQRIVDDPASLERLSQNAVYTKDVSDHAAAVLELYKAALG